MNASTVFNKNQRIWNTFPEYYLDPWRYFTDFVAILRERGAHFVTFSQAYSGQPDTDSIRVILDHHIDHYPIETEVLARWELEAGVVSSIYLFRRVLRTHASQGCGCWNIDDLDVAFYQDLEASGFEIGYHHNAVGQVARDGQASAPLSEGLRRSAQQVFADDVRDLRKSFDVRTFIPHGGGEGNHLLDELPDECSGLIWAYNNRPVEKTSPKWENFTDSSGQNLKILRSGEKATYVVARDALHVKAWTAAPGLHHILLHPGRFGKGMPYEWYSRATEIVESETQRLSPTLYPGRIEDLPIDVSDLVASWEGAKGRDARERQLRGHEAGSEVVRTDDKYYLLTDCRTTLRSHLGENPLCIGFLLLNEKMDDKMRRRVRRAKQENRNPTSLPVRPDPESLVDEARANALFEEQFSAYFNRVFTHRVWLYLEHCQIPFGHVVLRGLFTNARRDVRRLAVFLERLAGKAAVSVQIRAQRITAKQFTSTLERRFPEFKKHFRIRELRRGRQGAWMSWLTGATVLITSRISSHSSTRNLAPGLRESDTSPFDGTFRHHLAGEKVNSMGWKTVRLSETESEAPAVDAHDYASQLLFCRRVNRETLRSLESLRLPEAWLNTIRRGFDAGTTAPAFGGQMYEDYVLAEPSPELLYQFVARTLYETTAARAGQDPNEAVRFAWPWSYGARAAMMAWERTGDPRFPLTVIDTFATRIATRRDSSLGRIDESRGRALRAWGTSYYDEYAKRKGYSTVETTETARWICNASAAGRICFPVGLAIEALRSIPDLADDISTKCERALDVGGSALEEFLDDIRTIDDDFSYVWRPDREQVEALNHQNSYAEALVQFGLLTGRSCWVRTGERIARYFRRSIRKEGNGSFVWAYKGFNAEADLREGQLVEDVAHAHVNMSFARFCHRHGIVFDSEDMLSFARTFTDNIYVGDCQFLPRVSPDGKVSSMVMKSSYPDHFLAWIQLADFDPRIRDIIETTLSRRFDLFPKNWFGGPVSAYAYAYRLP
jgi:hypothetical protein